MRVRRKKRTKRLIVLLSLLLLGIVGFRNILPNLGDVFQYHHVASGEYGWNLILVNRDNYIPDDYTVELTELSNGQKVDSRIYPSLQEMFDAARAEGLLSFAPAAPSHLPDTSALSAYILRSVCVFHCYSFLSAPTRISNQSNSVLLIFYRFNKF